MFCMTKQTSFRFSQGAELLPERGVRYRTWAPGKEISVVVSGPGGGKRRVLSLGDEPGGYRIRSIPTGERAIATSIY